MLLMGSELWQRLRTARIRAGLTQEQVAGVFSVSKSAVSQWERPARGNHKKAYPTRDKLVRFAELTATPLNWLVDDASEPTPGQSVDRQSSVPDSQSLLDRARVETATALLTADLNTINRVRPVLGLPPIPPTARLIESGPISPITKVMESGPIPPMTQLVVPVGGDEEEKE